MTVLDDSVDLDRWQYEALQTWNCYYEHREQLANAIFGLNGETGELTDMLKKVLWHGHEPDMAKAVNELGDVMYYVLITAHLLDLDLKEVMDVNVTKLTKRYQCPACCGTGEWTSQGAEHGAQVFVCEECNGSGRRFTERASKERS